MALLVAALALAQAASALPAVEHERLALCQAAARSDPPTALVTASQWLAEAHGPGRSAPQQCFGVAYVSLLRWDAAHDAFLAARDALGNVDPAGRARLAAMAGNAALAGGLQAAALAAFDLARGDAAQAGDAGLGAGIEADRARALVALGRTGEAGEALERARADAPQDAAIWLLSATLSRREGRVEDASAQIRTAAALAPQDPAVALEAGLIAALAGQDEAALAHWRSVGALAPDSAEARIAATYLARLAQTEKRP